MARIRLMQWCLENLLEEWRQRLDSIPENRRVLKTGVYLDTTTLKCRLVSLYEWNR